MNNNTKVSNEDVDWSKIYDYYEIERRDMYKTVRKPQNDSYFEMIKQNLKKYLNQDKTFAEIGFSAGLTLRNASKHFKKVYGLDISSKNVEYTKTELSNEKYNNIELYTIDIMKKNEKFKSSFDVIALIHGLEHFSAIDYPLLFDNIKYYLKKEGVFTGALPNSLKLNHRMCPSCNNVFELDGHLVVHNMETIKELFIENNFEIIYLRDINYSYLRKNSAFLKFAYIYYNNIFLKKKSKYQLEYIVKPK